MYHITTSISRFQGKRRTYSLELQTDIFWKSNGCVKIVPLWGLELRRELQIDSRCQCFYSLSGKSSACVHWHKTTEAERGAWWKRSENKVKISVEKHKWIQLSVITFAQTAVRARSRVRVGFTSAVTTRLEVTVTRAGCHATSRAQTDTDTDTATALDSI